MKKRFKIISCLLSLCMLLALLPVSSVAATPCGDGLTWTFADGVLTVDGKGKMYNFGSFYNAEGNYYEVIAPWEDIKSQIVEINIGKDVETIGMEAFKGCSNLIKINFAQDSVLERVEDSAFYDCTSIGEINLPDSVEYLGSLAYYNTASLKKIYIPASLKAFYSGVINRTMAPVEDPFTSPVEAIEVSPLNTTYASADGVLFTKDMSSLIYYPTSKKDIEYTVPDGVKYIETFSMTYNVNLQVLNISPSVEFINYLALYIPNLTQLNFAPDSRLTDIYYNEFSSIPGVKKLDLPDSLENIPYLFFFNEYSESVEELDMPLRQDNERAMSEAVTAMACLPKLKKITSGGKEIKDIITENYILENNVLFNKDKTVLYRALPGFSLSKYDIPETVNKICSCAFAGAASLTGITVPAGVHTLGCGAFAYCVNLQNISFAPGVKFNKIDKFTFTGCENLTSVKIPASVDEIASGYYEGNIFRGCKKLADVQFEDCFHTGYYNADEFDGSLWGDNSKGKPFYAGNILFDAMFRNMTPEGDTFTVKEGTEAVCDNTVNFGNELKKIVFPESIKRIGKNVAYGVDAVEVIIPETAAVEYIGEYSFNSSSNFETLKAAGRFSNIIFDGKNILPVNGELKLDEGITQISANAFSGRTDIEKLVLPASLKYIDNGAFSECTSLKEVIIPDSSALCFIGENAFFNCSALKNITLPAALKEIRNYVFEGCSALEAINVKAGNTVYASENGVLFSADKKVLIKYPAAKPDIAYTVPQGTAVLHNSSFAGTSALQEISIPASVNRFGPEGIESEENTSVFAGSTALRKVTFDPASSVYCITNNMFSGCPALEEINIPDSVRIMYGGFMGCTSLESITLPENLLYTDSMGDPFAGCDKLNDIKIKGTKGNFRYENGVLTDENNSVLVHYSAVKQDKTYRTPDGIHSISGFAFSNNKYINEVTVNDCVTNFYMYPFCCCPELSRINFTEKSQLKKIWMDYYFECPKVDTVIIPAGIHADIPIYLGASETMTTIVNLSPTANCAGVYSNNITVYGHRNTYFNQAEIYDLGPEYIPLESFVRIEEKAPTCTADGLKAYYKSPADGRSFEDANALKEIKDMNSLVIPAAGHSFTEKIQDDRYLVCPATETSPAVYSYVCSVCGEASPDLTYEFGSPLAPPEKPSEPVNPLSRLLQRIKDFFNRIAEFFRNLFGL